MRDHEDMSQGSSRKKKAWRGIVRGESWEAGTEHRFGFRHVGLPVPMEFPRGMVSLATGDTSLWHQERYK